MCDQVNYPDCLPRQPVGGQCRFAVAESLPRSATQSVQDSNHSDMTHPSLQEVDLLGCKLLGTLGNSFAKRNQVDQPAG